MRKLFISQPMKGKTDEEILMEREKAIKIAEERLKEPVEVIQSFFQGAPADAKPLWFLGKSLELLATADVAYFSPGWSEARGCVTEKRRKSSKERMEWKGVIGCIPERLSEWNSV